MLFRSVLNGHKVVIVRSGIGKVNAGICTQILADLFHVDVVINTGIAGSLKAEINIGDVVISTDAVQHDMDATGFGYKPGVIPRMETSCFKADPTLVRAAKAACEKAVPEIQAFTGRIVSGDQFISDRAVKDRITAQFGGMCTEMEGAAIAQAAYLNKIPFVLGNMFGQMICKIFKITVRIPETAIARLLIAPSTSPISIALAVPIA